MRILFTLIAFIYLNNFLLSQLWTNPITGTNPNTSDPYTTGQAVATNLTVSGIGRGSGISGTNANNRYNANSWNTVSIDLDAYFYFTLTPNANYKINFVDFIYTGQASGTGPTSFVFRSSVDGFTTNIGTPTATGATIDLSGTSFQNINSAITFRLYGFGASGAGGTFSVNDFTFNGQVALPVEFLTFDLKNDFNVNKLFFSTASETNNDYFTIERSTDGRSFDAIGKIIGAGNSSREIHYSFTDEKPLSGINYYRIMQTDFDGKYSYSEIRSVRMSGIKNITVTPRTTDGRLEVNTELEDYSIAVYNAAGQEVKMFSALSSDQYLHIDELKAGLYFLRVVSGADIETIRVVKL